LSSDLRELTEICFFPAGRREAHAYHADKKKNAE
jgi:hypothetical protein